MMPELVNPAGDCVQARLNPPRTVEVNGIEVTYYSVLLRADGKRVITEEERVSLRNKCVTGR